MSFAAENLSVHRKLLFCWAINACVLKFFGSFEEAPLAAGLSLLIGSGIGHLVDGFASHFTSPPFLAFVLCASFRLRGQAELDQASDGLRERWVVGLIAQPSGQFPRGFRDRLEIPSLG